MDRRFGTRQKAGKRRLFVERLECRALFTGDPLLETPGASYGPVPNENSPADAEVAIYSEPWLETAQSVEPVGANVPPAEPIVPVDVVPVITSDPFTPILETTVVEVVEISIPDTSVPIVQPIAESELPQTVVDAVDLRFPGAEVVVAELRDDNGAAVYEVQTEFEGRPIGVTLTDDGSILDTAMAVTPTELPQPVQDWVSENFPGASIGTAALVTQATGISYDLLIATPAGEFVAATLRLQNVRTPNDLLAVLREMARVVSAATSDVAVPIAEEHQVLSESPSDAKPEVAATAQGAEQVGSTPPASSQESKAATENDANRDAALIAAEQAALVEVADELEAPLEEVAEDLATASLPALMAALDELLTIDLAAVEQNLMQLLADVDEFAESVASSDTTSGMAMRGALVAALIAAARTYMLESRRRKLDPVLAHGASNSTWGWLLATTTPSR